MTVVHHLWCLKIIICTIISVQFPSMPYVLEMTQLSCFFPLSFKSCSFYFICMSILPICMSVSWADNVQEGQKRASDGSQGTDGCELTCFWEQQPKNGFSARIISTCEHWDISPFPSTLVFDLKSLSKLGAYWISSLLGSHAFSDAKTSVGPIKTHYLLKTPFNL